MTERVTDRIDPMRMASADRGWEVVAAAFLPGVAISALGAPDDRIGLWDPATGSYALAIRTGGGAPEVDERGPRSLWSELEEAYLQWLAMGAPGRDRSAYWSTDKGSTSGSTARTT
ncbi:hypothetical protein [Nocardiopsis suaedae]|uniref:SMI1/KNR4 family protein n=1 Tax=Nocardiopsis suaedae TaxID=3018444 RepID=A0ABT4TJ95_9ACTN|nr:hypothetical protein [Nocardiopsis suaedae]MDA2804763.1 hypothetical protein [Nocardiopsis suaedae]